MTNRPPRSPQLIGAYLLFVLLVLIAVTVLSSWLLSVAGFDVSNFLSPEGVRWLFRQRFDASMMTRIEVLLLLMVVVGAIRYSGLWNGLMNAFRGLRDKGAEADGVVRHPVTLRQRRALWLSAFIAVAAFALLAVFVSLPSSPLRSATGRVWPSPFLHGLLQTSALIMIGTCAVYGATSRHLRTPAHFAALFYHGIQRYALFLVIWYLIEVLISMIYAVVY